MKSGQKGFITLLIIIVILILASGGGFYVYTQNKKLGGQQVESSSNSSGDISIHDDSVPTPKLGNLDNALPSVNTTLDLSSVADQRSKDSLLNAWKKPADFNQHYVIAEMSCGTSCLSYTAIDKNTGKVYQGPKNNSSEFSGNIGKAYNINSSEIRVIAEDGLKIYTYAFTGDGFVLVSSEDIEEGVATTSARENVQPRPIKSYSDF